MKPIEYDKLIKVGDRVGRLEVIEPPIRKSKVHGWKEWFVKIRCDCGSIKEMQCIRWTRKQMKRCRACQLIGSGNYAWNGIGEINGQTLCHIRNGAKSRGLKYAVTKEFLWALFLKQERKCALSGLPIQFTINKSEKTASLDRIDSTKGYTKDNVQWIHKDVNLMKNHFDQSHFLGLCKAICEQNRS